MKTLGERIKQLRKKKEFTLEDLSQRVGYSKQYLSDLENGRRTGSEEALQTIGKILGDNSLPKRCPSLIAKSLRSTSPSRLKLVWFILSTTDTNIAKILSFLSGEKEE